MSASSRLPQSEYDAFMAGQFRIYARAFIAKARDLPPTLRSNLVRQARSDHHNYLRLMRKLAS